MKKRIHNPVVVPLLLASILPGSFLATTAQTQTIATLHNFSRGTYNSQGGYVNTDGIDAYAGLVLSGDTLYGTASSGGASSTGTIFKLNTDGTGFAVLHNFAAYGGGPFAYSRLVISGDTLYGTTPAGGIGAATGTIFAIKTNGTGFTILHNFPGDDGYGNAPNGVIISGSTLYGANQNVLKINNNGTGLYNLFVFGGSIAASSGELVLAGSTLYGAGGGVFKINTDGSLFCSLHSFPANSSDGSAPYGGLALSGTALYGTTSAGGGCKLLWWLRDGFQAEHRRNRFFDAA